MLGEYLRLALKTLKAYRLRSTLTVLSITIGVLAVILLTSLAQSGLATLARGIEEIGGSRFIMIWGDAPKKAARKAGNYTKGLTYADTRALSDHLQGIERITALYQGDKVSVHLPGQPEKQTDLIGTDPSYLDAFAMPLGKGRNLTAQDLEEEARVCVVGDELAQKLFKKRSAVGEQIVIKGDRYRIVGELKFTPKSGMNFGFSWNDLVIVPLTTLQPEGRVAMIAMTRRADAGSEDLLDRVNAILMHRHNQVDDFQIFDMGGMLKGFYAVFYGMILIVGLIAGMSLVIGGVGIMNIMLVAVAERRREIGLRKAVGATQGTIMRQFLVEAVVLSLFGAAVGAVLGVGLASLASVIGPQINKGWVGVVSQPAVFLAILASAGVGLFFGWYPAKQAAELDPILCLRSE